MGFFKGAPREDLAAYKAARANLASVSEGLTEETDEFIEANHAVIEAEQKLPWWQR